MKLWRNSVLGVAVVLVAGNAQAQGFENMELIDLRVPLEHFADGTVKTEVTAKKAKMGDSGALSATGLQVNLYDKEGKIETRIDAEVCEFDRIKKTAYSDAGVVVTKGGLRISGTGFEWVSADQKIKIKNNVEVTFEKSMLDFNFSMLR